MQRMLGKPVTANLYDSIPEPPAEHSAGAVIVRMIDGLAFRYRWSLEGLDDKSLSFRPSESSMSLEELLEHLHFLAARLYACFVEDTQLKPPEGGISAFREETLRLLKETRECVLTMTESSLANCKIKVRSTGEKVSFWYALNGPLSDALTHVGQVNAWRRLAGSPVPKANVFLGRPPSS